MKLTLSKSRRFAGTVASLAESRAFIRQFLCDIGWHAHEVDIQLAIGEVMQNIIRHGFGGGDAKGQIDIYLGLYGEAIECVIADNAPPSSPKTWRDKARNRNHIEGGRGQKIIEALASSYQAQSTPKGNKTRLVFCGFLRGRDEG